MKLGQKLGKVGVAAWVVLGALGSAQANQKFCVYDMLGATGDLYNMTKDYAVAMQRNGVTIELKGYTELLTESREEAVARMIKQAEAIGANAVVNVRFSTSSVAAGAAELFAYGTALVVE